MSGVIDTLNKEIIEFNAGDTVKVHYKIVEGDKSRVQPFEGIVISKKGTGASKTFTVRRIGADNIGVERIFPLNTPWIKKITLKKKGHERRAKLYYLRNKTAKDITKVGELVKEEQVAKTIKDTPKDAVKPVLPANEAK